MPEYIEREALKQRLPDFKEGIMGLVSQTARQIVDSAPAVDVEPIRHGKYQDHLGFGFRFRCSCCKYALFRNPWKQISHNYCPNCGAKMGT